MNASRFLLLRGPGPDRRGCRQDGSPRRVAPPSAGRVEEGHAATVALMLAVILSVVLLLALASIGIAWAQGPAGGPPARGVAPADRPADLDSTTRAAIVDSLSAVIDSVYVFPETAARMEALVAGNLRRGDYDRILALPDFAQRLTQDLRSISKDGHLTVLPMPPAPPPGTPMPTPEEQRKAYLEDQARENYGFAKAEHLAGNVGYLDLRGFVDAGIAGKTALAAMNMLGNSDALIFDLRKNGGGEPSMIQLLSSCLFSEPTHLNDFHIRRGNQIQQFWTPANVAGPDLSKVPVWVLTSSYTFSGAEEFAYNLKTRKRATIVGETTGGGAHPINSYQFPSLGVAINVPFGRAVNPITGTNWEGTGVEPDLKVSADEALRVAHLEALKALRAQATDPQRVQALTWAQEGIELSAHPVTLATGALRAYEGSYGPRRTWVEDGALYYQRAPQPRVRLIPVGDDTFFLDGIDYFRLRFAREGGRITKLVGSYQDGRVSENPRD
jgi:retinol-binding protein 3